jgi:hypothetical protein
MSTPYTPEPWSDAPLAKGNIIISESDWKRAVACVNACAGMPNPKIFIETMNMHVEAVTASFNMSKAKADNYVRQDKVIREIINADSNESTEDEVIRLKLQRDDLLAALKMVLDDPNALDNRPRTAEVVNAAIAKAKGGANG